MLTDFPMLASPPAVVLIRCLPAGKITRIVNHRGVRCRESECNAERPWAGRYRQGPCVQPGVCIIPKGGKLVLCGIWLDGSNPLPFHASSRDCCSAPPFFLLP